MKKSIKQFTVILVCVLLGFNTKVNAQNTLYDLVAESESHTVLKRILDITDLDAELKDNSNTYTLVAPTNDAFLRLAFNLSIDTSDIYALPDLSDIVKHHLISGNHDFSNDSDGELIETIGGQNTLKITNNAHIYVNNAEVDETPTATSNGSLYISERVLLPYKTVIDEVIEKEHSDFFALIVGSEDLLSYLSNPFFFGTLLSVSNSDINKLLTHFDVEISEILADAEDCYDVVTMHIVNDGVDLDRLINGDVFTAMNDDVRLKVSVNNSTYHFNYAKILNGQSAEPYNGNFYVVDELIVPTTMIMDDLLDQGLILFAILIVEKQWMPEFCSPYYIKTVLAASDQGLQQLFVKLGINNLQEFLALPNGDDVIKYHWIEDEDIDFSLEDENTRYTAANGESLIYRVVNDSTFINEAFIFTQFPFHSGNGTMYPMMNAIEDYDDDEINVNKIKAIPVKAYPNPTADYVKFEGITNGTYKILDIQGRTIVKGQFNNGMVDVRTIAKGGYFISLQQDNQFYAGAFVKK
jgi:uncharacterized surface protein with fasciclin (FAS1) repeats